MICTALTGARIFDGAQMQSNSALVMEGARIGAVVPEDKIPADAEVVHLNGGILSPGFVDLQVNGGGGLMFNDDQSVAALQIMASAHARLGATSILPTLITDTPARVEAAIDAVADAIEVGISGIIGLHLEGPHLSIPRKGAHDPALIRKMEDSDLELLCEAAKRLPILKVTLAAETVTPDQIATLARSGVLVSLGHSDADYGTCYAASTAGARCVTHLFNAMSQLGNREPGLVGAALEDGSLSAGLIADGIHVHPATIRAALAAKMGPGVIFLVSDAMALAGSERDHFTINGRMVRRGDGRLTLEDGTLAGADLDLLQATRNLIGWGHVSEDTALAMATSYPATVAGVADEIGTLKPGARADVLHLKHDAAKCAAIWQGGQRIV